MISVHMKSRHDFAEWRDKARGLLRMGAHPADVTWFAPGMAHTLFTQDFGVQDNMAIDGGGGAAHINVPAAFIDLASSVICHRDEARFARLYRLLWRMQSARGLMGNNIDDDVRWLRNRAKAVHRDVHKMHAFVRFRKVGENNGREAFAAWFEPDHYIVDHTASFFVKRFHGMDWAIITPYRRAVWHNKVLTMGDGGKKSDVPDTDVIEDQWRTYYGSIFNPARVKIQAMQSEMPKKYWKNLPEAQCISPLLRQAQLREDHMRAQSVTPANPRARKWQANSDY
jgi:uracil-DNA glycosylase